MGNLLCSKEYLEFYDHTKAGIPDLEAMASHIAIHLPPLASFLHMAALDATMTSPPNLQNPDGFSFHHSFVVSNVEQGLKNHVRSFETGEKGSAVISVYPEAGHEFTKDEINSIDFLLDNIFVLLSRARMLSLLNNIPLTDGLTGVPNVAGFMRFGNILIAKNTLQNYTGIFVNIKNFKFINQTIGPRNGDKLLIVFAQNTKRQLGADEMMARLGGDNFMVLIRRDHEEEFLRYLNSIQLKINIGPSTRLFDIDVRAGIYHIEPDVSMNDLMANASTALNIARGAVKEDFVYFRKEMRESVLHAKRVSNLFHMALLNSEFVVYYQPKVDLYTNKLCGCEALVRWIQDGKIVPPMSFIPILEQEGSVCELDFYVFEQVCRDLRAWLDAGLNPVTVSSNFSKIHLLSDSLAADILAIIEKYDIPKDLIEIELTEMSSHDDNVTLSNFIDTMHAAGVRTSIDDFGTGYSSVNLLKDLNVDIIKLDRSFLNEMELRTEKEAIVIRNIVNMIHELGMNVIAEGVETKGQADFLKSINCHMAQGFLYDKPIPHDDFEQRLINRVYLI